MPWNAVSLGTRLAGRYRLELELRGDSGMARWAAIDELLNRGVGVSSLPAELPHAADVMSAAPGRSTAPSTAGAIGWRT